jgi:hypothetical protein
MALAFAGDLDLTRDRPRTLADRIPCAASDVRIVEQRMVIDSSVGPRDP